MADTVTLLSPAKLGGHLIKGTDLAPLALTLTQAQELKSPVLEASTPTTVEFTAKCTTGAVTLKIKKAATAVAAADHSSGTAESFICSAAAGTRVTVVVDTDATNKYVCASVTDNNNVGGSVLSEQYLKGLLLMTAGESAVTLEQVANAVAAGGGGTFARA